MHLLSWSVVRYSIASQWQLEVPLNYLVADASDVPNGKNHIRSDQVKEGDTYITDTNRKRDTDIVIREDLKIYLKRKLNLKVKLLGQI